MRKNMHLFPPGVEIFPAVLNGWKKGEIGMASRSRLRTGRKGKARGAEAVHCGCCSEGPRAFGTRQHPLDQQLSECLKHSRKVTTCPA